MTIEQRVQDLSRWWSEWWTDVDIQQLQEDVAVRARRVINECGLQDIDIYDDGVVCLVFSATMNGQPVVVKIVPNTDSSQTKAMRVWQDTGICPRLLHVFDDDCTVIMEKVTPGLALKDSTLTVNEKLVVAGEIVRKMHGTPFATADYKFKTMMDKVSSHRSLQVLNSNIPVRITLECLLRSEDKVLTHGDLHFGNILLSDGKWKMIDAHAIIAERNSEVIPIVDSAILLPEDNSNDKALINSWIDTYCHSGGLDGERFRKWLLVELSVMVAQSKGTQSAQSKLWRKNFLRMVNVLS